MSESRDKGQVPEGSLSLLLSEKTVLNKLAITGGIAAGKSTVTAFLEELGLTAINADQIVRDLRADPLAMAELGEKIGESRSLSTELLREALKHQDKRRIVNHFFHGKVWKILADSPASVVEVPLLLESCLWPFFKEVWNVACPREIRLERLTERLGDRKAAENLIKIQSHEAARAMLCDRVLNSGQGLEELKIQVLKGFASLTHGIGQENRL